MDQGKKTSEKILQDRPELATSEHGVQDSNAWYLGVSQASNLLLSWEQRSAVTLTGVTGGWCRTVISEFGRWGMDGASGLQIQPGLHMKFSLTNKQANKKGVW